MDERERIERQRVDLSDVPAMDDRGFVIIAGRPYLELSENGWGAVIAEIADPDRVRRAPLNLDDYTTTVVHMRDGRERSVSQPRSEADQRSIDDEIDDYLAAAHLAPRSRGFRWFLEVPPGVSNENEFWRHVVRRFDDLTSATPDNVETREALAAILRDLWAT